MNELARMIAEGFAQTATKQELREVEKRLDGRLRVVESKLDRALYTELTILDSRVRRLEEKAGFKS